MASRRSWVTLMITISLSLVVRLLLPSSFPADKEDRLLHGAERQAGVDFAGPESLAFDPQGRGPYTGVADGRILRWDGPSLGWTDFSTTSPNRTDVCKPRRPPMMDLSLEPLCGRPLGLRFGVEGDLYIADAYYGLMVVGPEGGPATSLVAHVGGKALLFPNDVDVGEDIIYFTDSSTMFQKKEFVLMFLHGDNSGQLISFKPSTKEIKVVLSDLYFPNGIALSRDKSFLLICETLKQRVLRYWIKGPKAGTVEQFATLPGFPDNIRLTERDDFWVAIHAQPNWIMRLPVLLRRALLKSPVPFAGWYINMARKQARGMVVRLDSSGQILEVLEDRQGKVAKLLSGVEERDGVLWLGSVVLPQILKYRIAQ
ncbi:hypothetical protein L7F22_051631 [Adiantum nelumboides]|nr:hypothetical protein [Adiantum nelumboides]